VLIFTVKHEILHAFNFHDFAKFAKLNTHKSVQ